MKKISKGKLPLLWERLARESALYLPVEEDGVVNFAPWDEGVCVNLETLNSVVSPKWLFFPQTENYLRFKTEKNRLNIEPLGMDKGKFIIFGIRPCDVSGFTVLNKVFLEEPCDQLYKSRREGGIILSLGCNEPAETCFCSSFDLEPAFTPNADVALWDLEENFFWKFLSEKGFSLTGTLDDLLKKASPGEEKEVEKRWRVVFAEKEAAVARRGWKMEGSGASLTDMFNDSLWDKLFRRCLGCGICTYLCPTCHCFDVQDYSRGQEGMRFRCWDSCMFAEFTLMASGENPRPTPKERVRQRFLHKLLYFPLKFGIYACVGCGRCVRMCPVHLEITQVIREFGGVNSGS